MSRGAHESRFTARSYELDGFGHVNHAVFLNWLEQARFEALEAGGYPVETLNRDGWAVVIVRVEVDFEAEVLLGDGVVVRTRLEEARRTSMVLAQEIHRVRPRSGDGGDEAHADEHPTERGSGAVEELAARARVVAVWLKEGRPERIPAKARAALGLETE